MIGICKNEHGWYISKHNKRAWSKILQDPNGGNACCLCRRIFEQI